LEAKDLTMTRALNLIKKFLFIFILLLSIAFLSFNLYNLNQKIKALKNIHKTLEQKYITTMKEIYTLRTKKKRLSFLLKISKKNCFKEDYLLEFHLISPKKETVIVPVISKRDK
jgi:hypothetical protein